MLGTEPEIVANYVETGQVKLVFWPVLNHSDFSIDSHSAAECVAQQSMDAFWVIHEQLFMKQNELWNADRDYYVETAVSVGVDQAAFEACYDGTTGIDAITALDAIRREQGIFSQPVFDINGTLLAGRQSFEVFEQAFQALLP